ncbi:glycerophosphodiester phosphodiesterase [Halobacteriales archaeon QS_8_69_26]|nr:MAG: glycerophosphodiester phosphodiesterase [Halobacteriales archaeon QS_8_69_26]
MDYSKFTVYGGIGSGGPDDGHSPSDPSRRGIGYSRGVPRTPGREVSDELFRDAVQASDVNLIAHRGFAGEAPDNTVAAMVHAADRGADAVEFDVRRCASGDPVVIHDATVGRVTDGTGRVDAMTVDDLAALDVLGSGECVPTLSAVLDAVPEGVDVNAELKDPVVESALPVLRSVENDVLVSSFDPGVLAEVRDAHPGVPTGFLCTAATPDPVERAVSLDCRAIHPEVDLALSGGFVDRAHDAGLTVNAWTVTDRETADPLREAGVDGLISDRSDVV